MHRLLALAFAAWFIVPVHAEEWDWDIGYKRPGFVHHHHRNPHYVSDIDRERVRLPVVHPREHPVPEVVHQGLGEHCGHTERDSGGDAERCATMFGWKRQ